MQYKLITHGCQMNEHDAERIAYLVEEMGYVPTEDTDAADLILMNTCLVRENAALKVYGQIGALKAWHEAKPGRILAVSGCMMQTGPAIDTIRDTYPQVDVVFGTQNINRLPELLARHRETGTRIFNIEACDDQLEAMYKRSGTSFAYVTIMTGCNNFCAYCVVPYARGREMSRPAEEVLLEVKQLAEAGYQEVMLLGQNVNSYQDPTMDFPTLLKKVAETPGIRRVRFMSSHPKDLSNALIDVMATHPNIERHFHLPLQSGSNAVLRAMNRNYTREHYLERVDALRARIPEVSLSTDIIVGFPGETEEDHQETLDLVRRARYDTAFTFIYSPRPGTNAAKRIDQFIDPETTSRRFQELLDTLYPIFLEKNRASIGEEVEVLLETTSKNDARRLSGRDAKNRLVHIEADPSKIGTFVRARIVDANSFSLIGEIIAD